MKNLMINKPYFILWGLIPIILGMSLINKNSNFDIQLHDTYIVSTPFHLAIICSLFLAFIGGIYWLVRKLDLINWMTVFHLVVSSISILALFALSLFEHDEPVNQLTTNNSFRQYNSIVLNCFFICLISQIVFLVNLVITLVKTSIQK